MVISKKKKKKKIHEKLNLLMISSFINEDF